MKNFITLTVVLVSSLGLLSGCFYKKQVSEETAVTKTETKKTKEIVQDSK
jgi:protein involved in sex pheromone biosynthesis